MSLSIGPAPHPVPVAPNAEQQTQFNQLVNKYKTTVSHDPGAAALESLTRQITVAARALGQTVRLPTVLTATSSAPPVQAEAAPPLLAGGDIGGRVNATA